MGNHDPGELWSLWQREKIDVEMATGHVLQNLLRQQEAQTATNLTVYQLRDRVATQQAAVDRLRTDVDRLQAAIDRLTALIEPKGT